MFLLTKNIGYLSFSMNEDFQNVTYKIHLFLSQNDQTFIEKHFRKCEARDTTKIHLFFKNWSIRMSRLFEVLLLSKCSCNLFLETRRHHRHIALATVVKTYLIVRRDLHMCLLVMGRTPFYRTLNRLEHHFLHIKQTQTCSPIGDRARTPCF